MAGPSNALLGVLINQFVSGLRSNGKHAFFLWLRRSFRLFTFFGRRPLLRIARTLLAPLVLAPSADLICTIGHSTMMAGAVDTHANGLLDTLNVGGLGGRRNPFVRLQCQSIFGKESSGSFLLESAAIERLRDWLFGSSGRTG